MLHRSCFVEKLPRDGFSHGSVLSLLVARCWYSTRDGALEETGRCQRGSSQLKRRIIGMWRISCMLCMGGSGVAVGAVSVVVTMVCNSAKQVFSL